MRKSKWRRDHRDFPEVSES
uniref:Uncharacterized protein n=1 Tax=Arundo donax TaxID=35708 RepID=A0A0A9FPX9_ARUDO